MARLRAETREDHVATEAIPFSSAILTGGLPRASYAAQLAAYLPIHDALEMAIASAPHAAIRSVWGPDMHRVQLLRSDLDALGASTTDLPPATRARAEAFAEWIRQRAHASPIALLGVLYVLEGSTLGGALLSRRLAASFRLEDDGLRYYTPYGRHPKPHWTAFSARMNAAVTDQAEMAQVIDAARETFVRIGEILVTLSDPATSQDVARSAATVAVAQREGHPRAG